jgi:hypothetical protein
MKNWPVDDTKTVYFSDLTESVANVIRFGYELKRINRNKNIPYKGYNIDIEEQSGDFDPVRKLKAENLKYSEEEQGRDLIHEAVGIAVQLGIAQGRRMQREKMKMGIILMKLSIKNIKTDKNSKEMLKMSFDVLNQANMSLQKFSRKHSSK